MRKRTILIVAACAALILTVGGAAYTMTRTTATPHFWAKAKATRATVACLAANQHLNVPKSVRSDIEQNALLYLQDVPAGTNVDVRLATYSAASVTGSDYYPAAYGNYNFTMTKGSDGWRITDFKRCY